MGGWKNRAPPDVGLAPSAAWRPPPCAPGPLPPTSLGRPLPEPCKRSQGGWGEERRRGRGGRGFGLREGSSNYNGGWAGPSKHQLGPDPHLGAPNKKRGVENLTIPKRGFGPPLVRYVFHPPQVSVLFFFPVQNSTTEQTRSSFAGVQNFSGERVLWYVFLPPYVLHPAISRSKISAKEWLRARLWLPWTLRLCDASFSPLSLGRLPNLVP